MNLGNINYIRFGFLLVIAGIILYILEKDNRTVLFVLLLLIIIGLCFTIVGIIEMMKK